MKITHSELKNLIHYDLVTGIVTWKVSPAKNIKAGDRAGTVQNSRKKQYRDITIKGYRKREHCWIWFYLNGTYPIEETDHINGDGTDNRIINIRLVSKSENRHNTRKLSNNKSGITGVYWDRGQNAWVVNFVINGKQKQIAQRKDFFEACCIRKSLERRYNYSYQHGSDRPY